MQEKLKFKNENKEEKEMKKEEKFEDLMYENEEVKEMETEKPICKICGEIIEGSTYNPAPITTGVCCELCNEYKVIPARVEIDAIIKERLKQEAIKARDKQAMKEGKEIQKKLDKIEIKAREMIEIIKKANIKINKTQERRFIDEMQRETIEETRKIARKAIIYAGQKARRKKRAIIEREAIMYFQKMYGII